ncbi:polysaccharide deacetylase family protein [Sinosporangium siamense]|uniref:polysaccharide deacetylase family protein n=1 Tax=Sinosporangium siamense TaxID=1367973 RepID=UPI0019521B09|nr:polysaccharide deacetylase family protein [Sinosporangium siamense]
MINYVDPAKVPGLTSHTITDETNGRHVHITHPLLKDAPALNERLKAEIARQVGSFTTANPRADRAPYPEFTMDWRVVAQSPSVLGIRLRTGELTQGKWINSQRTLWYDKTTRTPMGSADLLKQGGALGELAKIVRAEGMERKSSRIDGARIVGNPMVFDSFVFNRKGDLVVEFDDYQVSDAVTGRVALAVDHDKIAKLLSATGHRAREARIGQQATHPVPARRDAGQVFSPDGAFPAAKSSRAGSVNCAKAKCVAITFDGPGKYTPEVAGVLKRHDARATFFTAGPSATAHPDMLRRLREEGHLIGNHSWSHRTLSSLPQSKVLDELERTQDSVVAALGQRPTLLRPPYGEVDDNVITVSRNLGLAVVIGDVNTHKLKDADAATVEGFVTENVRNGSVVLLHDTHGPTREALPGMLRALADQGYKFVTVPELYGNAVMEPGKVYLAGPNVTSAAVPPPPGEGHGDKHRHHTE